MVASGGFPAYHRTCMSLETGGGGGNKKMKKEEKRKHLTLKSLC